MRRLFTEHPASVGETYGEHFASAASFSGRLLLAALACFAHALLPFVFVTTASTAVRQLHDRMIISRRRTPSGPSNASAR